jgi:hypothetical protein
MQTKNTTRRAVLAGIAAAPAALAAPALSGAWSDPIFAAIEAHGRADAKHGAACRALGAYQEIHRDTDGHFSNDSEEQKLDEAERDACHVSAAAGSDLLQTVPTTIAGALAVLDHFYELERTGKSIATLMMRDEDGEERGGYGYNALLNSLREMLAQLQSGGVS